MKSHTITTMKLGKAFRLVVLATICCVGGAIAQLGCATLFGFEDTSLRNEEGGTDSRPADSSLADSSILTRADSSFLVQDTQGWVAPDGTYKRTNLSIDPSQVHILVRTDAGFLGPFYPTHTHEEGVYFDDLPDGERYVYYGRTYVVHGNRIDVGTDKIGRPDSALAPKGTTLLIVAPNASDGGFLYSRLGGSVSESLFPDPPPWNIVFSEIDPLIDETHGDVAWVSRRKSDEMATSEICTFPNNYRMADGGASNVTVTCATTPLQHFSLSFNQADFVRAAQPDTQGDAGFRGSLVLVPEPGGGSFDLPDHMIGNDIATFVRIGATPASPQLALSFDLVNPAPATWTTTARINLAISGTRMHADGGTSKVTDRVFSKIQVGSGSKYDIDPPVGSVSEVTIGGKDALHAGVVSGVGPEPIIVRLTPFTDLSEAPTAYAVMVNRLSDPPRQIAYIVTSGRELALPPGLLEKGKEYDLGVETRCASFYSEEEPGRGGLPAGNIATITNSIVP